MRKTAPRTIKRDALSLYELVKRYRAGEPVIWAGGAYDNERLKDIATQAFSDAYHDMGALDDVFATVLKCEADMTDAEFHKAYSRHFPYEEPSPEAWRAAMYVSAYILDADMQLIKPIGLPVHLPPGACAFESWCADSDTIGIMLGSQDYRMSSFREGDERCAVYYVPPALEEGQDYNFMAIGTRENLTGRAIIVGYCVAADEHTDVAADIDYRVAFYRGTFKGFGPLEYVASGDPTLIVEVLDP